MNEPRRGLHQGPPEGKEMKRKKHATHSCSPSLEPNFKDVQMHNEWCITFHLFINMQKEPQRVFSSVRQIKESGFYVGNTGLAAVGTMFIRL